jgi:hypothetical protein
VVSGVARDPAQLYTLLVRPVGSLLVLPSPVVPSLAEALVSLDLDIEKLAKEGLVLPVLSVISRSSLHILGEVAAITCLLGAATITGAVLVLTLVTSAASTTVQPLGTVGVGKGPFAYEKPKSGVVELFREGASLPNVFIIGLGDLAGGEDLVVVSVECDVAVSWRSHETSPGRNLLEGIADDDEVVRLLRTSKGLADDVIALGPQLLGGLKNRVALVTRRLIEELDTGHSVASYDIS